MIDVKRLKKLYLKGWLTEEELTEYADLRKNEYLERKAELIAQGATDISAIKGLDGDIIACTWIDNNELELV